MIFPQLLLGLAGLAAATPIIQTHQTSLAVRGDGSAPENVVPPNTIICSLGEKKSPVTGVIEDGIKYLRGVHGKPQNDAGKCGQVSCDKGSAIIFCNRSEYYQQLDSFSVIADAAQKLIDSCEQAYGNDDISHVQGRIHLDNHLVVDIKHAKC